MNKCSPFLVNFREFLAHKNIIFRELKSQALVLYNLQKY